MLTKSFTRKADAVAWAAEVERDMRLGRLVSQEAERRTLADLITRYEEEVLEPRSSTDVRKRKAQLAEWRKRLGAQRLIHITPPVLAEERNKMQREGRAAGTVNRYLAALSHAFTIAVREWGWLESNPARDVSNLREPRGRVRFLSDDERARLLVACSQSSDDRLHAIVVLALSTGMRQGEILGLRWRDVDVAVGRIILEHTKNGDRRAVPLAGPALHLLEERAKVRRIDCDWVFPPIRGTARPSFNRKPWVEALETAGIDDFKFHDLRHSAASYLAMNGASLVEIADILGHKTLAMVKRYAHLSEQHTRGVVASMNAAIFGEG